MRKKDLEQLLDQELAVIQRDEALHTGTARVARSGPIVHLSFERGRDGRAGLFRIDCRGFDARPPSVAMVSPFTEEVLPIEQWTAGVPHSIHPLTRKPFVCIQGTAEYHTHPSHLADSWDRYRNRFRIPQLIRALLHKAGAA